MLYVSIGIDGFMFLIPLMIKNYSIILKNMTRNSN